VVIPQTRLDDVLSAARDIAEAEDRIRTEIEAGSRLDEARRRHRYFSLQKQG